ncbi:VOC family protein [Natrialbaceae archaeon A-arb3/5]
MTQHAPRLPESTALGRTALRVADKAAAVEFYRDVVGLAVVRNDEAMAALGAGETPLLVILEDEDALPRRRDQTGLFHTAFRVPNRAALGDALSRVRDDWRLDGASDHGFSEALYLADPEGNGVEIYRDRPRAEWPRDDDGSLGVQSIPLDLEALAADAGGESVATVPTETDLGHVHLEAASIANARAFYHETLGFDVSIDAGPSATFFAAGGYHHHVGVNTWNGRSNPVEDDHCGLAWFEIVVPDDEALAGVRDRLADASVSIAQRRDGFALDDPNGIEIRFRSVETEQT